MSLCFANRSKVILVIRETREMVYSILSHVKMLSHVF